MTKTQKSEILDWIIEVGYELINLDGTVELGEDAFRHERALRAAWKIEN